MCGTTTAAITTGLFEWMRGLPYIRELTEGAALSAYGTKIIRSGGWRERPDARRGRARRRRRVSRTRHRHPLPEFHRPCLGNGPVFRAGSKEHPQARRLLDAQEPARANIFFRSRRACTARTQSIFPHGRPISEDRACSSAGPWTWPAARRIFSRSRSLIETGRFLRSHILSFRGLKELARRYPARDRQPQALERPLRLPDQSGHLGPLGHESAEADSCAGPEAPRRPASHGRQVEAAALPWPLGSLVKRTFSRAPVAHSNRSMPTMPCRSGRSSGGPCASCCKASS